MTDSNGIAGGVGLLPCPFCGGTASADGRSTYTDNHEAWFADGTRIVEAFFVNCMTCGATRRGLAGQQTRDLAIAAWNTRLAAPAEVDARVEAMRPTDEALDPHLPDKVRGAKRCGIQRTPWLGQWFVGWSPRNDNENCEGPWSDWVLLAEAILTADAAARAAALSAQPSGDGA